MRKNRSKKPNSKSPSPSPLTLAWHRVVANNNKNNNNNNNNNNNQFFNHNHKNYLCPHRYPFTPGWREAIGTRMHTFLKGDPNFLTFQCFIFLSQDPRIRNSCGRMTTDGSMTSLICLIKHQSLERKWWMCMAMMYAALTTYLRLDSPINIGGSEIIHFPSVLYLLASVQTPSGGYPVQGADEKQAASILVKSPPPSGQFK